MTFMSKGNVGSILMALGVGFGILGYQNYAAEQHRIVYEREQNAAREARLAEWRAKEKAKEETPASEWYVMRGISVRDFVEGEEATAQVSFDSETKKPFVLEWDLQAYSTNPQPGEPTPCSISDRRTRTPKAENVATIVPWPKLWDRRPCHLAAGEYVLTFHGVLKIAGFPDKEVERTSNIFRVLPKGAQLYVEPEQAQKLESIQ